MPEGDTIFRAARTLNRALAGRAVIRFETPLPALMRVDDDHPIAGRLVESVASVGKHLLMRFSGDLVLRTHMRMNGSWHIYKQGEAWRRPRRDVRVLIETDPYVAVGFSIPVAEFLTAAELGRQKALTSLGPDLLGPAFDAGEAVRRMRAQAGIPIAEVILNQRVLCGIGNVFKSEILFEAKVHPFTPAGYADRRGPRADRLDRGAPAARQCRRAAADPSPRLQPPDHREHGPVEGVMGLQPRRSAVPDLRDGDRQPQDRTRCAGHLLVSVLPAGGLRQTIGSCQAGLRTAWPPRRAGSAAEGSRKDWQRPG